MYTYTYGADSETCRGKPISLQFYSEQADVSQFIEVDETSAMDEFFWFLGTLKRHATHVIYCHNLAFDLVSFFYKAHRQLGSEFEFTYGKWKVQGCYGTPTFAKIRNSSDRDARTIFLVDSFLWYQGSLANAAELFCPGLPKLTRPKDLGQKVYTMRDDKFVAYAMRDAEIADAIGQSVQAMHAKFDIPQSVSLAHMASQIFRRQYLDYTIPQPPDDSMIEAALESYHGGKNNVIPGAAPAWHRNVKALDISSAYPYAMSILPAFSNAELYRKLGQKRGPVREVDPFGVYQISGEVEYCDWPCIFDAKFKPQAGRISDIWVQGIELNEALRSRELRVTKIRGYYYEAESDNQDSAFKRFVLDFYAKKESEKNKVLRHQYKITLNSLYGKLIQTRRKKLGLFVDIDPETDAPLTLSMRTVAMAGGMYHPFIASAITAHTRAYIHRIEHAFRAIHTATDGIYTTRTKPVNAGLLKGYPKKGLGSLQSEGEGTLMLVRNKCYILYADSAVKGSYPSKAFKGKHIVKAAKHGFQGSVHDLEKLVATGKRKYTVLHANKLKESLKHGLQVNDFVSKPYVLKVGPIKA